MAGVQLTDLLQAVAYSSAISYETVRVLLIIDVLNDINVRLFYIGNVYMNAYIDKNIYLISGEEFVPKEDGEITVVVKALYVFK